MPDNFEITRTVKRGYTKLPNAILRDEDLTVDARIVICFLLSITQGFHLTTRGIAKTLSIPESRVKRAISLLENTGYIKVEKVRNGKLYGGYKWLIADVSGFYRKFTDDLTMDEPSIHEPSIHGIPMHNLTMHEPSIHGTPMAVPIYEQPIGEKLTVKNQQSEEPTGEGPTSTSSYSPSPTSAQQNPRPEEEAEGFLPYNPSFTPQPSSVANAPSLSKNTGSQPSVISQKEYLYQQFLKKYPKKPTGMDAAATKQAFFDIPDLEDIFAEIMAGLDDWCNSVDWNKEGGRYITKPLNFITTRKWEEIPRTIKTEIDPGLARFMNSNMEDYI